MVIQDQNRDSTERQWLHKSASDMTAALPTDICYAPRRDIEDKRKRSPRRTAACDPRFWWPATRYKLYRDYRGFMGVYHTALLNQQTHKQGPRKATFAVPSAQRRVGILCGVSLSKQSFFLSVRGPLWPGDFAPLELRSHLGDPLAPRLDF